MTLKYRDKDSAAPLMEAHRAWVEQGFSDGVFLLIGPILLNEGGMVIADNITRADLDARVNLDPLVAASILEAETLEIGQGRAIEPFAHLFN